jgi:hypothetical protein
MSKLASFMMDAKVEQVPIPYHKQTVVDAFPIN